MKPTTGPLTLLTLLAFAANSVLCRLALKQDLIDPIAFTQIRLMSGALVLVPILWRRWAFLDALPDGKPVTTFPGSALVLLIRLTDWRPALALFVYAITFSLAYVALDAGMGALILFAMVQTSMIGLGIFSGHALGRRRDKRGSPEDQQAGQDSVHIVCSPVGRWSTPLAGTSLRWSLARAVSEE